MDRAGRGNTATPWSRRWARVFCAHLTIPVLLALAAPPALAEAESSSRSASPLAIGLLGGFLVLAFAAWPIWSRHSVREFERLARETARAHLIRPSPASSSEWTPSIGTPEPGSGEVAGEGADPYRQFCFDCGMQGRWSELAPLDAGYGERWWRRRMDKAHYGVTRPEGLIGGFDTGSV